MRMQKAAAAAAAKGRQATTRMGTRSKGAANGNNGNSSKMHEMEVTAAAAAYDSDSFENHVIDLRGDEEYQSMREGDESEEEEEEAGDSGDFEEHFSMNKDEEGVQSHSDTTFGNTVSATEGANTDSEMEATKSEQHGDPELSNGVVATNPSVSNGGEGTATEGDEGSSLPAEDALPRFMPGQLVWAKFARFPWWPAQVTDERTVQEGTGGHQRDDTDVLVHFFGTYDFGWVDPNVGLAEFDVKLQERSKIRKKALQKGIEEALEFRNSGKLPEFFAVEPREPEPQMPNNDHCNGLAGIQAHASQSTPEDEETGRRVSRKRKPKVLYEEEERVQRKPERRLRRLRIMRQLGLVAPAGSPFTLDTRMSV